MRGRSGDFLLKNMKIICFLRDVGLPINSIGKLFEEEKPENIISLLLDEQEKILTEEISERQAKLKLLEGIKAELKTMSNFSVESISDIAYMMKTKNKLKNMRITMLLTGIPVTALQWASIILWITNGLWWLFAIWAGVATLYGVWVSIYYFNHTAYICPECHTIFQPRFKESFFAHHTPRMRRLTCPNCHKKGLCLEVWAEKEEKQHN